MTNTRLQTAITIILSTAAVGCFDADEPIAQRCGTTLHAGDLDVSAHSAESLREIVEVEGDVLVGSTDWTDLSALACLRSIEGDLTIVGNEHLTAASGAEALRHVWGTLTVAYNGQLDDTSSLARLELVGSIVVAGNERITELPWLASIEATSALVVVDDASLGNLDSLASLGDVGSLRGAGNPALTAIDAGALERVAEGDIHIGGNTALTDIEMPALLTLDGTLTVRDNSALPTCSAHTLADQLIANGYDGTVIIDGNDDDAVCP